MLGLVKLLGVLFGGIGLLVIAAIISALPVMWLWNALMPDIFGLVEIGFWQALGINILSGMLFNRSSGSKE